jgi:hypothetical protein
MRRTGVLGQVSGGDGRGVWEDLVAAAHAANDAGTTMMQQSGAIRRIVPWSVVCEALFGS